MAVHGGGRRQADGLADLSHRRGIASIGHGGSDEVQNLLLPVAQFGFTHAALSPAGLSQGVSRLVPLTAPSARSARVSVSGVPLWIELTFPSIQSGLSRSKHMFDLTPEHVFCTVPNRRSIGRSPNRRTVGMIWRKTA